MIYERVIKRKATGSALVGNAVLIAMYVLGLVLCVFMLPISLYFSVLWLLLTLILFLTTRRYLSVEFEYSIDPERLSVSKIYGKRSRRLLLEIELKKTVLTAPADEENTERLNRLRIDKVYSYTSFSGAPNTYFTVFQDEDENNILVYFEGDEKSLTYFKRANPIVTTVRPFLPS